MEKKAPEMEDPNDVELRAIMGDRWHDQVTAKPVAGTPTETSVEAEFAPTECDDEAHAAAVRRVKSVMCAMTPYTVAFVLLLYWQAAGIMDAQVAQVSSTICAVLATLFAGRAAWKGESGNA